MAALWHHRRELPRHGAGGTAEREWACLPNHSQFLWVILQSGEVGGFGLYRKLWVYLCLPTWFGGRGSRWLKQMGLNVISEVPDSSVCACRGLSPCRTAVPGTADTGQPL